MKTKAYIRGALLSVPLVGLAASAQAQGTCADLNILSLTYAAFSDTAIEVVAHAAPGTFFSYPSFSLVNDLGDTLTHEEVNFFGIGENELTHSSALIQGQTLPPSPFVGTLVFTYYGLDDLDTCVFPIAGSLCPPDPCTTFHLFLYNTGSLVDASFAWTLTDEDGATVASGTFEITAADQQADMDEVCLPAGVYNLHIERTAGPPGAYQYGAMRDQYASSGPWSQFFESQPNDLPLTFFGPCIEGTNSVEEQRVGLPFVSVMDGYVTVTRTDGSPLGTIDVIDASGRTVHRSRSNDQRTTIDVRSLSPGVYLLNTRDGSVGASPFTQRFLLN